MSKLDFIKKLYNGKNCYSDHMSEDELELLHVSSSVEGLIVGLLRKKKIIFLTGNPGDGKTFLIKAASSVIKEVNAYVELDVNNISSYDALVNEIISCYFDQRPAIIAVNEYPFIQLCKEIKRASHAIYNEIIRVKKEAITYDIRPPQPLTGRIALIDLNDRNLLDLDRKLLEELINKFLALILEDTESNKHLEYNVKAISKPHVKEQLLSLMQLAALEGEHFSIRDILGAFAFIFTACLMDEHKGQKYYSVIFDGTNPLLEAIQQFDPIYLSSPVLDEKLWNGELPADGWLLGAPQKWSNSLELEDDLESAIECFKENKRRYFFEHIEGGKLQPEELKGCLDLFINFHSDKRKIKGQLIKSINKLFLPSSDEKRLLYIWTTHRYDMSIPAAVAVSSKSIEAGRLDIHLPRPADWLNGMEFVPNHIIMTPKDREEPKLMLDISFLKVLYAVEKGYPVSLLSPQYEQAAAIFLQKLDDERLTDENDGGEIIIASRRKNQRKSIFVRDGQYGFEED